MTNGEKNVSKKENFCTILSKLKLENRDMKNSIKNYSISVGDQIQITMTECLYSYAISPKQAPGPCRSYKVEKEIFSFLAGLSLEKSKV